MKARSYAIIGSLVVGFSIGGPLSWQMASGAVERDTGIEARAQALARDLERDSRKLDAVREEVRQKQEQRTVERVQVDRPASEAKTATSEAKSGAKSAVTEAKGAVTEAKSAAKAAVTEAKGAVTEAKSAAKAATTEAKVTVKQETHEIHSTKSSLPKTPAKKK